MPRSILFITLDSCRYDAFVEARAPNLKSLSPLHRAQSPSHFTFGAHAAFFMGFTPGDASRLEPYVNPKYGKIFRMEGCGQLVQSLATDRARVECRFRHVRIRTGPLAQATVGMDRFEALAGERRDA